MSTTITYQPYKHFHSYLFNASIAISCTYFLCIVQSHLLPQVYQPHNERLVYHTTPYHATPTHSGAPPPPPPSTRCLRSISHTTSDCSDGWAIAYPNGTTNNLSPHLLPYLPPRGTKGRLLVVVAALLLLSMPMLVLVLVLVLVRLLLEQALYHHRHYRHRA